jgi:YD repeat-containing protein
VKIQVRRGTAAQWTTANPVLAVGERGYETDTKREKIGDGVTSWISLPYLIDDASAKNTYGTLLTPPETITYNPDGTVSSQTIGGVATTYTYNGDGTVATETRAGVTRTYTYTAGVLTAVA